MKRSNLINVVDAASFIGFVFLASTGVLLRYVLPPGSGRWSSVWSLSRHDWGAVHFWISVAFFAVLTLHLVLHWRFVLSLLRGKVPRAMGLRLALGMVGLLAILALAAAPLLAPVDQLGPAQGGRYGAPRH